MRTEKLYYEQSHESNFSAKVIASRFDNGKYLAALDRTLFYPEGGGQPCDTGSLGGADVIDVQEDGELIWHTLTNILGNRKVHGRAVCLEQNGETVLFREGETVEGQVNFKRRFNFMQNHSGEHILSGLFKRHYGLDNVGFHMGSDAVTLDMNGSLPPEEILLVEREANEAVFQNVPIKTFYPDAEALKNLSYRSKKELTGEVRIVNVEGYDSCACCGIHCRTAGEIGMIKIISAQKYKKGMRLSMLCGFDALSDYIIKNRNAYELSSLLSVPPYEITQAAKNMIAENGALKQRLSEAKKEIYEHRAAAIPMGTKQFTSLEKNMEPYEQRQLALALAARVKAVFVFSQVQEGEVFKYALASRELDVRAIGADLNKAFEGKGGGSRELVQGTLYGQAEKIKDKLDELLQSV